jgi:hypothetical protein
MCAYVLMGECSYMYEYLRLYCIFKKKIGRNFVIKFSNLIPLDYMKKLAVFVPRHQQYLYPLDQQLLLISTLF